jgi:hypothetical protein
MTELPRPARALTRVFLSGMLVLAGLLQGPPLRAGAPTPQQLEQLESALNSEGDQALQSLLEAGPGLDPDELRNRRKVLRNRFPDARWTVRSGPQASDGSPTVTLQVTGSRREGPIRYRLEASQQLALQSEAGKFNGQTVLREESLLRSGEELLPVSLLIPDAVLTGQRYDVDVIFDDPLDGALVAGGILALSPRQVSAMDSPSLELGALAGGGLFKSVQAPFNPGAQTWAVLLVHPKGVVSATKRVRVVTERSSLTP